MIHIEAANYSTIIALAEHEAIDAIHPNFEFRVDLETPEEVHTEVESPEAVEWNVAWVCVGCLRS